MDRYTLNNRHIAVVCNARSGKGKSIGIVQMIVDVLKTKALSFNLFIDEWPEDFAGFSEAWLVGGDGTLNYFVNRYPEIQIPIALFKGGSGNDFAWKLYGNLGNREYLDYAPYGKAKAVDAGTCNGNIFMNGVGIGFDGDIVRVMGTKRTHASHFAYLLTVLKRIFFFRESEILIHAPGMQLQEKIFLVSIANGSRYGGGFMVAPGAQINDGLLDLIVIKAIAPVKRLFYLPQVEKGTHLAHSFVVSSLEKKITIETSIPVPAHLDGEAISTTRFEIEVLPGKYLFIY